MTLERSAPTTSCSIRGRHTPSHKTTEWHHVVPVAWQLIAPIPSDVAPFPGRDPDGRGMLWDNRGVWLCPTHHRNVHAYLTRLMRQIAMRGDDIVALAAKEALTTADRRRLEPTLAMSGMQRFLDAQSQDTGLNRDLLWLTSMREWGEA